MLDADMQRVVSEQRLGYVASVAPDGTPNLSPKGTLAVWDDAHLVFAHLYSAETVANIEAGYAVVEVNVVDPILRKGYRFKGPATCTVTADLREGTASTTSAVGSKHDRIQAIVLIWVGYAARVVSPAYDDGSTEADIEARSLQMYGLTRSEPSS